MNLLKALITADTVMLLLLIVLLIADEIKSQRPPYTHIQ